MDRRRSLTVPIPSEMLTLCECTLEIPQHLQCDHPFHCDSCGTLAPANGLGDHVVCSDCYHAILIHDVPVGETAGHECGCRGLPSRLCQPVTVVDS